MCLGAVLVTSRPRVFIAKKKEKRKHWVITYVPRKVNNTHSIYSISTSLPVRQKIKREENKSTEKEASICSCSCLAIRNITPIIRIAYTAFSTIINQKLGEGLLLKDFTHAHKEHETRGRRKGESEYASICGLRIHEQDNIL